MMVFEHTFDLSTTVSARCTTTKILLTGFEPFGNEPTNPSWEAAQAAARMLVQAGGSAAAIELPCVFGASATMLVAAELTRLSIPAEVSQTAGSDVCNHVFYALMHLLVQPANAGTRGGFIHIPYSPGQVAGSPIPSMDVATAASGLAAVARLTLSADTDSAVAAGSIS